MRKIVIFVFLLFLSSAIYTISWEIETDIGIKIEINDVTKDYDCFNRIMQKEYKYIEISVCNNNPNINFKFSYLMDKALFIDKKNETFRHKNIYFELVNKLTAEETIKYQDIIERLGMIDLGYRESGSMLLVFEKDFDFFDAEVFKIQFGSGLYIEYYKKEKEIRIIDEYSKLKLE